MAHGLSLQITHPQHAAFSRVFERCPVLIGRDSNVANCVLPDNRVSRVHASIDIRDRWVCIRDSGSTNGTFVGGQRIPADRWVAAGNLSSACEIQIGDWRLLVAACEIKGASPADGSDFLTSIPEPPAQPVNVGPTKVSGDAPAGQRRDAVTELAEGPTFRVGRAWARVLAARSELINTLAAVVESAPAHQRPELVREILQTCVEIEREPGARALLERHGGKQLPHTLESASALALQELARWYVSDEPPLANANEVVAFARKLKTGIDELLLGILPMFSGLDRFEHQMALRPSKDQPAGVDVPVSSRLPRAPRDAARQLFNWRDPSDAAIRAVRTDLVDLTMHQVAVLNGVMRGVKQLLAELAPAAIEKALQTRLQKRSFFARLFGSAAAERWDIYRERHGDLADEENERFRVIFGPEFVAEYKQSGGDTTAMAARITQGAPAWSPQQSQSQQPPPPQQRPTYPQNRT